MDISVVDPHVLDSVSAQELADIDNAASQVDSPWQQPVSGEHVRLSHRHGFDGRGTDHLLLARDGGQLLGFAGVELPFWDNRNLGFVDLQTHPEQRGIGVGEALLDRAVGILRDEGRGVLMGDAWLDSHRAKFWHRNGLKQASVAAQRRLLPDRLDWPRLDALLAESEEKSADYDILVAPSPSSYALLPHLVELQRSMNDAPIDDLELEDDVWNEERLRGFENAQAARRIRLHRLVARRRSDGEYGGFTVVGMEEERPWLAFQEDTGVIRGHRGHRLGLRLKVEMLRRLRDEEPQIEQIDTWNAESNSHMIAVNDALGCFVVGRGVEFQKHLDG